MRVQGAAGLQKWDARGGGEGGQKGLPALSARRCSGTQWVRERCPQARLTPRSVPILLLPSLPPGRAVLHLPPPFSLSHTHTPREHPPAPAGLRGRFKSRLSPLRPARPRGAPSTMRAPPASAPAPRRAAPPPPAPLCLLALTLLLWGQGGAAGPSRTVYTNHWAVRVRGGPAEAARLAAAYGYISLGQVRGCGGRCGGAVRGRSGSRVGPGSCTGGSGKLWTLRPGLIGGVGNARSGRFSPVRARCGCRGVPARFPPGLGIPPLPLREPRPSD